MGRENVNTVITSKEAILETSRKLIQENGWAAVNIRSVAQACNISVGSVYNYFDSKSDLIAATVERVCAISSTSLMARPPSNGFQTALNGPMNVCGVGMKYIPVSSPCTP